MGPVRGRMVGIVGLAMVLGVASAPLHVDAGTEPASSARYSPPGELAGDPDVPVNPGPAASKDASGEPEPGPVPIHAQATNSRQDPGRLPLRLWERLYLAYVLCVTRADVRTAAIMY